MKEFFVSLFNNLVRDVSPTVRIIVVVVAFLLAILSVYWCIRKKNDSHPIAWGWVVLCIVSLAVAVTYIVFGTF